MRGNILVRAFLKEAEGLVDSLNMNGAPNKAMFWGHTSFSYGSFSIERNSHLCELYRGAVDRHSYRMDTLSSFSGIASFFDRYTGDYPPEILDVAWDVFSKAFAESAVGDHIFVAANDMKKDDYFERVELPEIRGRFTRVTAIEPALDQTGTLGFQTSEWSFCDWEEAQRSQWENPDYYLDGSAYPNALRTIGNP